MPAPEALDVRILADDLTGGLDSAVAFAADQGVGVTWRLDAAPGRRTAVDVATREGSEGEAAARHRALAPWLAAGALRFKKVDSLLRGHVAAEIEACLAGAGYERVVVAPAFPFQGRVTRVGRQWRLGSEAAMVGPDLAAVLLAPARRAGARLVVCDAESDADLDAIVATQGAASRSVLWVGSGGLAAALARRLEIRPRRAPHPAPPFLGLVGTDHPTTLAQTAQFAGRFPDGDIVIDSQNLEGAKSALTARMRRGAPSLAHVAASGARHVVAACIERTFAALLEDIPRPGTLLVTGGETLRAVCDRLGARLLVVQCEIEPGLPSARIDGGRFDGLTVISKSGGFGDSGLFARLGEAGAR